MARQLRSLAEMPRLAADAAALQTMDHCHDSDADSRPQDYPKCLPSDAKVGFTTINQARRRAGSMLRLLRLFPLLSVFFGWCRGT